MRLHEMTRGSICGFQYWSMEHWCWKPRVVVVVKRELRKDGTWRTLCRELASGDWKTFVEGHVKDLRPIYIVAAEKTEPQARAFADGFGEAIGPEWLVLYALADPARVVHGFGPPHAVLAVQKAS